MSNDIKNAKKLYDSKKYEESLELYEDIYNQNPELFKKNNLISYCWAIYQVHVKNVNDEDEIITSAEEITHLIPQADLNYVKTCPYTFTVFKVLDLIYKQGEYYNLFYWLEKISPKFLDEKRNSFKGRTYRSRKEKYYDYLSKASLECAEWELCIETSKEALNTLKTFTNNGDTWHNWRIAKSLKELNHNRDALDYLKEVLSVKKEWYVYKEIAENYCILNENRNALTYIPQAVLTDNPIKIKVNLFHLIYILLKDENPEMALKHAQLYCLLKDENNAEISSDIEDLNISTDDLNKEHLANEIVEYWKNFRGE